MVEKLIVKKFDSKKLIIKKKFSKFYDQNVLKIRCKFFKTEKFSSYKVINIFTD